MKPCSWIFHVTKNRESSDSCGMSWGPLGHSIDESQPKAAAKPIPVPENMQISSFFCSSQGLVAQTLGKAWLCWSNIKGRSNLLGRQHLNHLGLWRQEVKNNISSWLSSSPIFPSSPPSGLELQELRFFDVNLSDTLVSSLLCPALFLHIHICVRF